MDLRALSTKRMAERERRGVTLDGKTAHAVGLQLAGHGGDWVDVMLLLEDRERIMEEIVYSSDMERTSHESIAQ